MPEPSCQLMLYDGEQDERTMQESERSRGIFTGLLLREREPEKFRLIQELLLEGTMSQRQIALACRVSRNLVRVVLDALAQSGVAVEPLKRKIAGDQYSIAALAGDRLKEILQDDDRCRKVNVRDLALAGAVAIDKGQLLSGEATSRIEHTTGDERKDFERWYVDQLRSAEPAAMGCGAETPTQKDGPGPAPEGADPGAASRVNDPGRPDQTPLNSSPDAPPTD